MVNAKQLRRLIALRNAIQHLMNVMDKGSMYGWKTGAKWAWLQYKEPGQGSDVETELPTVSVEELKKLRKLRDDIKRMFRGVENRPIMATRIGVRFAWTEYKFGVTHGKEQEAARKRLLKNLQGDRQCNSR